MDREKAADLLDNLIGMVEDNHGADYDTALKMGIEALSTSGDGPEPVDDTISRQAAIDAAIEAINEWGGGWDAEREARDAINALPSAQPDLIAKIQNGIKATDADDVYSCGMRNGMRWCKSLIDGKEPLYENCPSAPPTEASCWGCNCPKMERLKEQKTFSEMVHLHDAETHEERTETHGVCLDTISRQMAIDAFKKELTVGESKGNYVTLCSAVSYEGAKQILESLPSAQPEPQWIPCSERLPEDNVPVNITWINRKPEFYYAEIEDVPFTATGVYFKGRWYWYSSTVEDYLAEYGVAEWDEIEEAIEVVAWMPLPEPWRGEE